MKVATLQPGGFSYGQPGPGPDQPVKRGREVGHTLDKSRRLVRFLRSIDWAAVLASGDVGVWVTLTVREVPDVAEWRRVRKSFFRQLRRECQLITWGVWVLEWQLRKAPHIHLLVFQRWVEVGEPDLRELNRNLAAHHLGAVAVDIWLRLWGRRGNRARRVGQDIQPVTDHHGINLYLAKHGGRTAHHYQRDHVNIPEAGGWRESTGGVWDWFGEAPRRELQLALYDHDHALLRRRVFAPVLRAEARAAVADQVAFIRDKTPYDAAALSRWFPSVREAAAVKACADLGKPGREPLREVTFRDWMRRVPRYQVGRVRLAVRLEAARRGLSWTRRWLSHPAGGWIEELDDQGEPVGIRPSRSVSAGGWSRRDIVAIARRVFPDLLRAGARRRVIDLASRERRGRLDADLDGLLLELAGSDQLAPHLDALRVVRRVLVRAIARRGQC